MTAPISPTPAAVAEAVRAESASSSEAVAIADAIYKLRATVNEYGAWIKHQAIENVMLDVADSLAKLTTVSADETRRKVLLGFIADAFVATPNLASGDRHDAYNEIRALMLSAESETAPTETAKQLFDRHIAEDTTPLERLRFFCSNAMNGQDWLDVEPFFDAVEKQLSAPSASKPKVYDARRHYSEQLLPSDKPSRLTPERLAEVITWAETETAAFAKFPHAEKDARTSYLWMLCLSILDLRDRLAETKAAFNSIAKEGLKRADDADALRSAMGDMVPVPREQLLKWRNDAGPAWVDTSNEAIVTLRVEIDNLLREYVVKP